MNAENGQLGVLTSDTDYNSLQKCYSIWICNEHIPEDEQNSMTRYHITKEDVIGQSRDIPEHYDLMEIIMIRRGKIEIDEEIFDFLNGLFKSDVNRVIKYTGSDDVIEGEVKKMGGFGQALVDKTEENTARLMSYLARNGRSDDIIKAASDPNYRETLFKEYQNTEEYKAMLRNEQKELEVQID